MRSFRDGFIISQKLRRKATPINKDRFAAASPETKNRHGSDTPVSWNDYVHTRAENFVPNISFVIRSKCPPYATCVLLFPALKCGVILGLWATGIDCFLQGLGPNPNPNHKRNPFLESPESFRAFFECHNLI